MAVTISSVDLQALEEDPEDHDTVTLGVAHGELLDATAFKLGRDITNTLHLAVRQLAEKHNVATSHGAKKAKEADNA